MKLDIREPTVVIAGAFNPAIFNPAWMAAHLYGREDGAAVEYVVVADLLQQSQRAYLDSVAVSVDPFRLSIFLDDFSGTGIERLERVAGKIAETLPHTPVAGVGINFKFVVEHPSADIVDGLQSNDNAGTIGVISQTEITTRYDRGDGTKLSFVRTIVDDNLIAAFNYHTDITNISFIPAMVPGRIAALLDDAKSVMERLYGEDETEGFVTALNKKEG